MSDLRALLMLFAVAWVRAAAADDPTAEEILRGAAPTADYGESVKCISSFKIERTEPLNERYIVFHLSGDALWLAQLDGRCPGLQPNAHLAFEKTSDRICQWDSVRVLSSDGIDGTRLGPRCQLPKFESVTSDQVQMLKQQLVTARQSQSQSQKKH